MRIGDITITPLIDGEAVVPATAFYPKQEDSDWDSYEYLREPVLGDYKHLNTLGGYLIQAGGKNVILDCGSGPAPKFPFAGGGFRSAFAATGLKRADITDVVFSHLHFDHIGWASIEGRPFFPKATYHVEQRDWDYFLGPDFTFSPEEIAESETKLGESGNYCNPALDSPAARLQPVLGQIEYYQADEEVELLPGIVALDGSGHTPGSVVIELRSDGDIGLLLGDLVHAQPELLADNADGHWNLISNTNHDMANAAIEHFKRRIYDEKIPAAAAHFPGLRWGRVVLERGVKTWQDAG